MDQWKSEVRAIRSRCGFRGVIMGNWGVRADHIADHFKSGKTMADWQGDWGFEASIRDMVENCVPPCMLVEENRENLEPCPLAHPRPPRTPSS